MTRLRLRAPARVGVILLIASSALAASAQSRARDGSRLPGPAYPDIVALYDSRQPAAALSALDLQLRTLSAEAVPVEALALRARLLSAVGQHVESATLWKDIAGREAALRVVGLRAALDSHLTTGNLQAAQEVLAELTGSSPGQHVDLLILVAAACRSAGLNDEAVTLYRHATRLAPRGALADEASLGLAAALEGTGHPAEALGVARALLLTFRTPDAYATAVARARRLSAGLGRPLEQLSEREYLSIADRLGAAAQFRQAIDVLTEWHTAYPQTLNAARIDAAIIENLYNMRANDDARARCALFLERYPGSSEAPAVLITQFRLDVREGQTARARARGMAIWRGNAGNVPPDLRRSAARLLAEYLVSIGEAKDGLALYDELYRATPGRADRIDLLWRSAIAAVRAGRQERAARDLRRVLALNPGNETVRAATYWLATIEDARGAREAAARHWTMLVERFPYSYYGVRAAAELGKRGGVPVTSGATAAPRPSFPDLSLSDSVSNHRDYRTAALLGRAGLLVEAASYAARLAQAFRGNEAVALLAARAAAAAGDHRAAFRLVTSHFGPYYERPADGLPDDLWDLAYPRAYWSDVQTAARRHGVDPFLMLALMQQESQFDPGARSPAGALGLFQIMPSTAERLQPGLGMDRGNDARLMQPGVSAEIAARLLADLITLFNGSLAPAIAAYNAGEDRVQAWWQAARDLPEELFIDSIPYRETRGYVREVLANYFTYRRLNGN